jgi:hypothetical protein
MKFAICYGTVHRHLTEVWGRAAEHACAHCGGRAQQWAYTHTDPHELTDRRNKLAYSLDLKQYIPLCCPCHFRMDAERRGRSASGRELRTHCPAGHEYTPENTAVRERGWRRCKTCDHEAGRRDRAANRDRVNATRRRWRAAKKQQLERQAS